MAEKKALTDEELLAQFDDIPAHDVSAEGNGPRGAEAAAAAAPSSTDADAALAQLESLARPASRPGTPKRPSAAGLRTKSPKRSGLSTPPSIASARTSEDKAPTPQASSRSSESAGTKAHGDHEAIDAGRRNAESEAQAAGSLAQQGGGGGGWWGGIYATATAAVKQAEAAVKEIQKNEEAQKWTEQVMGNVGALRDLGDGLRSRAMPTFSSILRTIAPPISQHERLQIHIAHDLIGYPSLDSIIHQTFSRVMSQVEGGDLLVIQRGSESTHRRNSDAGNRLTNRTGWNDGPWWRQNDIKRDINAVKGLAEGSKLVRASAEAYANDFFASHGGLDDAVTHATTVASETNPVRTSDIFLAIQAIGHSTTTEPFGSPADRKVSGGVDEPSEPDELLSFAMYLYDPVHGLNFGTTSQSFPQKWGSWLDATSTDGESSKSGIPDEILDIVSSGGLDPRDWVADWIEDILSLAVGIVAQRYVARRMGVGEGGIGRGKGREHAVESGAGEAARALV